MREMVEGQRLAIAAVALYVVVTLGVAVPPSAGRLAVLVLPGAVLMIIGVRSNLAVLVGAALALAGAGWSVRPVLDAGGLGAEAGDGRWLSAVLLGVGLLGCFELARLAVDAGPRHGPVRVEAALRRATERRFGMVAGLGVVGGAVAYAVTGAGRWTAPSLFLPLGVLAAGAAVAVVVVLVRAALPNRAKVGPSRRRGPFTPDGAGPRRRRRPRAACAGRPRGGGAPARSHVARGRAGRPSRPRWRPSRGRR